MAEEKTLLETAGGERRIGKVTKGFFSRVLADERVRHIFAPYDVSVIQVKLAKTVSMLLGGEQVEYRNKAGEIIPLETALKDTHWKLNITDEQYDIVSTHYMMSLLDAGMPYKVTAAIGQALVTVEPLIVRTYVRTPQRYV